MADAADGEKSPPKVVEVADQVEPLIQSLPPEKRTEVRRIFSMAMSFQGPLPPPEILEQYGQIISNGPERMMVLLEKQTDHRISMESQIVSSRILVTKRGQLIATGLSVFFGLIALTLGLAGHAILAGAIGVTTVVSLAVVFALGKEPSKKTNEEQSPPRPAPAPKRKKS